MCGVKQRAIALMAMQSHLESEIERLRSEGNANDDLERRVEELELVSEQLASVLSDPTAAELVAALR